MTRRELAVLAALGPEIVGLEIRLMVARQFFSRLISLIRRSQRLEKIVESNRKLPRNWKMSLPDFDSHYDGMEFIEDGDEEKELSSYEEE